MARCAGFLTLAFLGCLAAPAGSAQPLTMERIMADPQWIGPAVEGSFWALDGSAAYYRVLRDSSGLRDLHRILIADGSDRVVKAADLAGVDADGAVLDRARARAVFLRNGDVFLRTLSNGALSQLTRSGEAESGVRFSRDERLVYFRRGSDWWGHELATGLDAPLPRIIAGKDPAGKPLGDLEQWQLSTLRTLREDRARREAARAEAREQQRADSTRAPEPIYLGEEADIALTELSPDGRWMLVVTTAKGADAGRATKMPRYVTESGYEETEDIRTRVGRNGPAAQSLWLADLAGGRARKLPLAGLPGIMDDPLAAVRAENAAEAKARGDSVQSPPAPRAERAVRVMRVGFSADGAAAAVLLRAIDNKDRWIVTVDSATGAPTLQHRLTDPAWINWNFNDFGWYPDGRALWLLSEESGWSQLYRKPLTGKLQALTAGRFELSDPVLSHTGWFYLRGNVEAPYAYDVYRVPSMGGTLERVTTLRAVERFRLSPDAAQLLLEHSGSYTPKQLSLAPAAPGGAARSLTDTRTAAYRAMTWIVPRTVPVPSTHGAAPIWSKLYALPAAAGDSLRPIVLFVHGAGYLQNTTLGYPTYFREQMFHSRLVERGFLVLDMDYRASEGYGRDWRTAIYRRMGEPELEDLRDGVDYLVREHHGDPKRVGLYGGSYGGFMTLMALFRAPEVFRAGAALRPVTDWTTYNHEYTSNILNTPQADPLAYRRSSPIEYADGLRGALLICHGMVDDNVLFQDSVRLWQRLIELHKDEVEFAPYPMERHGFTHADSWLDEYKRIERLFESRLR